MNKNTYIWIKAILISLFLWVILFFITNYLTIFFPRIDSIKKIIDLDLAQVIIELLLIPLVLISFLITKKGYDDSQRMSVLELIWADESKNKIKNRINVKESEVDVIYIPAINLINNGSSMALHYKIILTLPLKIYARNIPVNSPWIIEPITESQYKHKFSLTNNDSNPIYPDEIITFKRRKMKITNIRGKDTIIINYEIYSDSGKKEIGSLILINEGQK